MGSQVEILESIIVDYAGPMGKFVVRKSMADLGLEGSQLPPESQNQLIDMVLERAIFDKDRWNLIRREIQSAWGV